ncbi:hypothetical protein E3N88_06862 [Mikania micrantha]|uniref:UDP-glycosyltransferases domain-containing protein n=1 Tax=Mikania micrantha TaxID=192012 RepID=A0A5N6PR71_9ASTR|nr:hypothetical protein E3N88_06862 [Mikania micrantha]
MENAHVLVKPYPAQGHVMPLIEVARCLTSNGLKVTFVNTEFTHKRVVSTYLDIDGPSNLMQMVSIPNGMEPCDDRSDLGKMTKAVFQHMPTKLEELINDINKNNKEKIACIIADSGMGWVEELPRILKLIDDEVINCNGVPLKDEMIQLSTTTPFMDPAKFVWACIGDATTNQIFFENLFLGAKEAADHIICSSIIDLEPGTFTLFPKMLPIVCSVIYVAFGSITLLDQAQFEELALGLELTKKSFLWVVRLGKSENMDHEYPRGYMDRIGTRGKVWSVGHLSKRF